MAKPGEETSIIEDEESKEKKINDEAKKTQVGKGTESSDEDYKEPKEKSQSSEEKPKVEPDDSASVVSEGRKSAHSKEVFRKEVEDRHREMQRMMKEMKEDARKTKEELTEKIKDMSRKNEETMRTLKEEITEIKKNNEEQV